MDTHATSWSRQTTIGSFGEFKTSSYLPIGSDVQSPIDLNQSHRSNVKISSEPTCTECWTLARCSTPMVTAADFWMLQPAT